MANHRPEARPRRPAIDPKSLAALLFEWLLIAATLAVALAAAHWAVWAAAIGVVATRQHALLMLYHDAVHGLLARRGAVNDLLINLLVGVPHLLPVEVYRPLHLAHHRRLGSADDPERTLLYAGQRWEYRPLGGRELARQLLGDLFVVNGVRTLAAWQRRYGLPRPGLAVAAPAVAWLAPIATGFVMAPHPTALVLAIWLGTLLTVTNLLQKLRSFAEHSGGPGVTPGWPDWTYSWRAGWLGRSTIWPYNINYHREHHARPDVPWHRLPALVTPEAQQLAGNRLPSLLYRSDGGERME